MAKALTLTVWFIAATILLSVSFDMISAANTIENCLGVFLLVLLAAISVKTKCFIKILTIWKKLSKSQSER